MNLTPEIYGPIAIALASVIGILYKQVMTAQDKLNIVQEQKLQLVLQEARDSTQMALAILKEEDVRERMLQKLDRIEKLVEELGKGIKPL